MLARKCLCVSPPGADPGFRRVREKRRSANVSKGDKIDVFATASKVALAGIDEL
jgi:hypothetical protein